MCLPRLGNRSNRLLRIVIYDGAVDGVPLDPASRRRRAHSPRRTSELRSHQTKARFERHRKLRTWYSALVGISASCAAIAAAATHANCCGRVLFSMQTARHRSAVFARLPTPLLCLSCKMQIQKYCASSTRANSVLLGTSCPLAIA